MERSVIESIPYLIVRHLPDSTILYVNPAFSRFVGVDTKYLVGQKWYQWMLPGDVEYIEGAIRKMTPREPLQVSELEVMRHDGVKRWIFWESLGFFDSEGVLAEIQVIGHDFTELKTRESKLRARFQEADRMQAFLKDILDHTADVESFFLRDGTIAYITPSFEEITGYSCKEFTTHQEMLNAIVHPDDIEDLTQARHEWYEYGRTYTKQYRIVNKSGEIKWFEVIGRVVRDDGGEVIGYRTSIRDVTRMKVKEEQLMLALEEISQLRRELEEENKYLKDKYVDKVGFEGIVTNSPLMIALFDKARQVAETNSPVLLSGETGTGKEMMANAIHRLSKRRNRMMITVNCAALPPSLIESELFGREKGAYTGALTKQVGRFEMADGSTIFLDEVGELPLEVQVKLLRVLQSGEYELLGSPVTKKVDVRIIAATNRDLDRMVEEGTFRRDLFYRLNIFPIHLPPLRERTEDIPMLVWSFIDEISAKMGRKFEKVTHHSMSRLLGYSWPGNVRELRNIIEYNLILSGGPVLDVRLHQEERVEKTINTLDEEEKLYITKVLNRTGWRIRGHQGAAELLGLKESTLRFRMKKLGIRKPGK